jgi:hypothetical protein
MRGTCNGIIGWDKHLSGTFSRTLEINAAHSASVEGTDDMMVSSRSNIEQARWMVVKIFKDDLKESEAPWVANVHVKANVHVNVNCNQREGKEGDIT